MTSQVLPVGRDFFAIYIFLSNSGNKKEAEIKEYENFMILPFFLS